MKANIKILNSRNVNVTNPVSHFFDIYDFINYHHNYVSFALRSDKKKEK